MRIRHFGIFILFALFAFFVVMAPGCSEEKEPKYGSEGKNIHELRKRIDKEAAKTSRHKTDPAEEAKRSKQMAVADACDRQYNSCLEKCKSVSCEDACVNALSFCERHLPADLKTIKDK